MTEDQQDHERERRRPEHDQEHEHETSPHVHYDERPWGSFTVLEDAAAHKVKRIAVHAGHRLSYQVHSRRSEHWFVIAGEGLVTLDGEVRPVAAGVAVDVPVGTPHRIENIGTSELVFIEVQHGDYFGEDDIVRLEDDFGRAVPTRGADG